jgi:hypothetical protein
LTIIGHEIREAIQFFTDELVKQYGVQAAADVTKTVDRLRAVIGELSDEIGAAYSATLAALVVYWGTVTDLAHRQEHGALKEREALSIEDTRRLVFQTAVVMCEIDRSFMHGRGSA